MRTNLASTRARWVPILLLVCVGCGSEPEPEATPPRNREPAASLLLDRWTAVADSLASLPRVERAAQLRAFLSAHVTMADLHDLCRDTTAEERALATLLRAYGDMLVLDPADVVDLLTDEAVSEPCRLQALRQAQAMRDQLSRADADAIGEALLRAADRADGTRASDLEVYAAQFARTDGLRARMAGYLASDVDSVLARGVAMARESRDETAGAALTGALKRIAPRIDAFPESGRLLVSAAARAEGARLLPYLEPLLRRTNEPHVQNLAIEAMGEMPAPPTLEQLLRLYPDRDTVPINAAALPPGGVRDRYAALYDAVRRLEAFIGRQLRGGSEREVTVALALLDRATRFGPMVEPPRLADALTAYAARPAAVESERALAIRSRLER